MKFMKKTQLKVFNQPHTRALSFAIKQKEDRVVSGYSSDTVVQVSKTYGYRQLDIACLAWANI